MLSQVNNDQKEKSNFCVFFNVFDSFDEGCLCCFRGRARNPGLVLSHKNTQGALCVFRAWGWDVKGEISHTTRGG